MESMLHITTLHYLVLGAALFLLGVIGVRPGAMWFIV